MQHFIILGKQAEEVEDWEFYGETDAASPEVATLEVAEDEFELGELLRIIPTQTDEHGEYKEYRESDLYL